MYRAAIASLYREKPGNSISDEHKAELQECARMSANEVREIVRESISTAIADLKNSAITIVHADSDVPSKSIENMHVEEERAKRLAAKKSKEKELLDSMQNLSKIVEQYVKREDETYQRIMDALPDEEKQEGPQEHVVIEPEIPKRASLDIVNSFFESSSEPNATIPSKQMKPVEHYDSFITDDYAKTAIEAEMDAVKEMEEVARPRDWREEFADYKKLHPEMSVDEMIDSFDKYYNGMWDKYNAQNTNREIRTKGR